MHWLYRLVGSRPTVEPQSEASDCGYVCISAALALLGNPKSVDEVCQEVGTTSRGLTIKQVRDGLNKFNVKADAVFFDKNRVEAFPDFGILLLDRGHFVVIVQKRDRLVEIFDPLIGWTWVNIKRLKRSLTGFGILIDEKTEQHGRSIKPPSFFRRLTKLTLEPRFLFKALGLFAFAEIVALALPLISMRSVDSSVAQESLSFAGIIVIGFLALSAVNSFTKAVGELIHAKIKEKMYKRLGGVVFDALSVKGPDWFERTSGASIQNQIQSLQVQLDFVVDGLRTVTMLTISVVAGLGVLLIISPWLAIPGLISLALTTSLDLFLARRQRGLMSASVEARASH
ncbi:MAG: cysteine peptidase family C39 domain-containing protein [Sphingomonadaceae bacterium]|jgi:ATP-binding cassette subfamily B protein RaxB